jgi:hypothetical protein
MRRHLISSNFYLSIYSPLSTRCKHRLGYVGSGRAHWTISSLAASAGGTVEAPPFDGDKKSYRTERTTPLWG